MGRSSAALYLAALGVSILALAVPLRLGMVRANRWYGIRFRQSFASPEHWRLINRYGAGTLAWWGVSLLVVAVLVLPEFGLAARVVDVIVLGFPLTGLIPAWLSYRYARDLSLPVDSFRLAPEPGEEGGAHRVLGAALIVTSIVVVAFAIPIRAGMVAPNHTLGVRFPQSFSSQSNWYRINRFGGDALLIWGVSTLMAGLLVLLSKRMNPKLALALGLFYPLTIAIPVALTYLYALRL